MIIIFVSQVYADEESSVAYGQVAKGKNGKNLVERGVK